MSRINAKGASAANASILLTGGAGFIGSHVADRLVADGVGRLVVVDDFNDFYDPALKRANVASLRERANVRVVEGDILDDEVLERAFADGEFDAIVHLAARAGVRPSLADPLLYQRVNVEGTYRLLEAARARRVPQFVFGSSSSVYGARSNVPFRETDSVAEPVSPYAATKVAGEAACHAYAHLFGIRSVCLRFFTVFGPRQRPDLAIRKFTALLAAGKPIPLFGDGGSARDYTYVDDIVEGVVSALAYDRTPYEVINLGGEHPTRLSELVEWIADALGVEPTIDRQPEQPGDVPITYADCAKAGRLLGYAPKVAKREGIRRFVAWYLARADASAPERRAPGEGGPAARPSTGGRRTGPPNSTSVRSGG